MDITASNQPTPETYTLPSFLSDNALDLYLNHMTNTQVGTQVMIVHDNLVPIGHSQILSCSRTRRKIGSGLGMRNMQIYSHACLWEKCVNMCITVIYNLTTHENDTMWFVRLAYRLSSFHHTSIASIIYTVQGSTRGKEGVYECNAEE